MKINKMLIAVLAMVAVVLSSCKDDDPAVGIDSGMPAPALYFDADNSAGKQISVYWNPVQAISAGATSFTVQLVKTVDGAGDIYDNTVSRTLAAVDDDGQYQGQVYFDNLAKGRIYYVRMRANYPRSVYSDWVLAAVSETNPKEARIMVGKGIVSDDEEETSNIEAKFITSTESSVTVAWTTCDNWNKNDLDIALPYRLELFKDKECKNLVVAWNAPANLSDATSTSNAVFKLGTRFSFSGLNAGTTYWARITNTADNIASDPVECATAESKYKALPAAAMEGEVILFQDFHELIYGGDYPNYAAGVSTTMKSKTDEFWPLEGDDPTKDKDKGFCLCSGDREIGLFNTLKNSVAHSVTLQDWGRMYEAESSKSDENGAICARQGLLKMGAAKYRGCVVTPVLKCLTQPATIEVSFRASAIEGYEDNETVIVTLLDDTKIDGSYWVTAGMQSAVGSARTGTAAEGWKTYTVTAENVTATSRIAIGGENGGGAAQHRFYLDDIQLKVVSYGELTAPDAPAKPELTATDKTVTATWEKVNRADGYKVEYKKTADADWAVAAEKVTETTYTIEGLAFETAYDVRVSALLGSLSSDPSEVASITTLAEIKQLATPQNVTAAADYGVATLTFDPVVGAADYEVYANGATEKLVGMVTSAADAAKVTYKVTGLAFNTAYTFQVKAVADGVTASELSAATESATTSEIVQVKNNVGPTTATVAWRKDLGKYEAAVDKPYDRYTIQIADNGGTVMGSINLESTNFGAAASTLGQHVQGNLNPSRFTFGALKPATTYKVRVKKLGEDDLLYSPWCEITTEAAHVKAAKEVLFQGFDEAWYGGDVMNLAGAMQATAPNTTAPVMTWESYIGNTGTNRLADEAGTTAGSFVGAITKVETSSLYGWTVVQSTALRSGYAKFGGSSKPGILITCELGEGVLNATTATPCTISFKAAPYSEWSQNKDTGKITDTTCEAQISIIVVHADGSETVAIENFDPITNGEPFNYVWKEGSVKGVNLLSTDKLKITSKDIGSNKCRFMFDDLLVVAE